MGKLHLHFGTHLLRNNIQIFIHNSTFTLISQSLLISVFYLFFCPKITTILWQRSSYVFYIQNQFNLSFWSLSVDSRCLIIFITKDFKLFPIFLCHKDSLKFSSYHGVGLLWILPAYFHKLILVVIWNLDIIENIAYLKTKSLKGTIMSIKRRGSYSGILPKPYRARKPDKHRLLYVYMDLQLRFRSKIEFKE